MMRNPYCLILLTALLFTRSGVDAQQLQEFRGKVIAYQPVMRLPQLSSMENTENLVFTVLKVTGEEATFIKVVYRHWANDEVLPSSMLTGTSQWRLSMSRDRSCDEAIKEVQPHGSVPNTKIPYQLTVGATPSTFPTATELPCYVLKPGKFSQVGGAHPKTSPGP